MICAVEYRFAVEIPSCLSSSNLAYIVTTGLSRLYCMMRTFFLRFIKVSAPTTS